ncbi:hypothetical protein DFH09DRAFT_1274338 [Mycena vulgaris]|nr:hypothetical protein DFH09DRAFT_1274338 [Mycena vulgaris]
MYFSVVSGAAEAGDISDLKNEVGLRIIPPSTLAGSPSQAIGIDVQRSTVGNKSGHTKLNTIAHFGDRLNDFESTFYMRLHCDRATKPAGLSVSLDLNDAVNSATRGGSNPAGISDCADALALRGLTLDPELREAAGARIKHVRRAMVPARPHPKNTICIVSDDDEWIKSRGKKKWTTAYERHDLRFRGISVSAGQTGNQEQTRQPGQIDPREWLRKYGWSEWDREQRAECGDAITKLGSADHRSAAFLRTVTTSLGVGESVAPKRCENN